MDLKLFLTKRKILALILICLLISFCYIIARRSSIINEPVPLSTTNIEAMFYVREESGEEVCIGDGLINSLDDLAGETKVAAAIVTSPDYTNYITSENTISWDTIKNVENTHRVVGSIRNINRTDLASFDHTWADTSAYDSRENSLVASINPSQTYYFAADGNDKNSGKDPEHPKKNPTNFLRKGDANILFKSGDIFTLKYNLAVGSNTKISTYGGSARAVINWVPINSSPFEVYDASQNIYSARIDELTDAHYKVAWIKLLNDQPVNWQKVFSYSDLKNNNDFYSDKSQRMLYIKSNSNLSGTRFAFASNAGGFTVKDCSGCFFKNLELVGSGMAININNASNVVIDDCYVHHVGGIEGNSRANGSLFRYGNGIQIWATNTNNIYVSRNYVTDCFDAGISPQISSTGNKPSDSIYIYDNYVDRCLYSIEFYEHNRENTIPLTNVFIQNNILTNAMDITNGYRFATYGFTSYLCTWSSLCERTSFTCTNNLGYGTTEYAYAFYEDSPDDVNTFEDNTFVVLDKETVEDCVKNYALYTGDDSDIIPASKLLSTAPVESEIRSRTSGFDKTDLFFSYIMNN